MPITYNNQIFKDISNKIHNFKYDYSSVNYINNYTNVKITCPIHGDFLQRPQIHMIGSGCKECSKEIRSSIFSMGKETFIQLSNKIHNNKYDYTLVEYINQRKKVKIICPIHGIFEQSPRSHYNNMSGCPYCDGSYKSNTIEFIEKSKKIHGDTYLYNNVDYKTAIQKVSITCNIHGDYFITPNNHLQGKGCPICKMSHGETKIKKILDLNLINYDRQKTFNQCKNIRLLPFDFYLIDYNIIIEFDGEQHFNKFRFETNYKKLNDRKINDEIKNNYCINNNIKIYRIKYNENIEIKMLEILSLLS